VPWLEERERKGGEIEDMGVRRKVEKWRNRGVEGDSEYE
jgi:hypothetical protein